jgi:hypothetical protein
VLLATGSRVVFKKSRPLSDKVGVVVAIEWCDISQQALFLVEVFEDQTGQLHQVYAFGPDLRGFRAPPETTMQSHAERRKSLRAQLGIV